MTHLFGQAPSIVNDLKVTSLAKCSALQNIVQLSHKSQWCITLVTDENNKAHACAWLCWSLASHVVNMPPSIRHKGSQPEYLLLFLSCLLQASFKWMFSCTYSLIIPSYKCYHVKAFSCNRNNSFVNITNCPINILYRYTKYYLLI